MDSLGLKRFTTMGEIAVSSGRCVAISFLPAHAHARAHTGYPVNGYSEESGSVSE